MNFERVAPDPDSKADYVTADWLREEYNKAAAKQKQRRMGRQAFKKAMEENGHFSCKHAVTGNLMTYFGLRPRTDGGVAYDPIG
jgi:hypothetical protein